MPGWCFRYSYPCDHSTPLLLTQGSPRGLHYIPNPKAIRAYKYRHFKYRHLAPVTGKKETRHRHCGNKTLQGIKSCVPELRGSRMWGQSQLSETWPRRGRNLVPTNTAFNAVQIAEYLKLEGIHTDQVQLLASHRATQNSDLMSENTATEIKEP